LFGFAPYSAATFAGLGQQDIVMSVTSGTFTLSMQGAPKLISEVTPSGEFNFTGHNVTLRKELHMAADSGSLSVSGQEASFNRSMASDAGSFSTSGNSVSFITSMAAAAGSFSVLGQDVSFNVTLPVTSGSFSTSGQDAFFKSSMLANSATFTLSLQGAAKLISEVTPFAEFNITGSNVTLTKDLKLSANNGSFNYATNPSVFHVIMVADAGLLATSGQDVTVNINSPIDSGSFSSTGYAISFKISSNGIDYTIAVPSLADSLNNLSSVNISDSISLVSINNSLSKAIVSDNTSYAEVHQEISFADAA